jgi:hypothetical protein
MPESAFLLTNVDTLMPASAKFSTLLTLSRMKASDGGSTCESETAWLYQGNASIEARRKATPLQRRSALEESSRGSVGVSSVNVAHSSPEEEESRSVRDYAVKRRGRQNWSEIVNLIGQRHATTSMDFCLRVTPPLSNQAFHTTNEGGRYADQILLKVGEPGENKAFFDQLLITDKEFTQLTVNVGDLVNPTTQFLGVYWLRTEFWVLTKKLKKSNKNDFCLLWMTPPGLPGAYRRRGHHEPVFELYCSA